MVHRYGAAALVMALGFCIPGGARAASSADLMTAVKNVSAQSDKFRSLMSNLSLSEFHFVNVGDVLAASDRTGFKSSLKKNAPGIADLRDTLNHTTLTDASGTITTLRKVLLAKNLSIDQIVAVYVAGTEITLYYQ